ncbi:urotensin-2-like [Thalassophryne amazonica]|uniref:urotensin-2-like n=1 Tax=Thalassophryne amazonica TaxID=390379 RepID=UPI001470CBB9|nr:urotensin-2-like [Thalassophryne amazonica]
MILLLCSWAVFLVASSPLLAHHITQSAELPYPGPVSLEERGVGVVDDLSFSEQSFPPQDGPGLRYANLISAELNRDGVRTGLLPRGMNGEFLPEKQSLTNPLSRMFGIRKYFRRQAGSDCFWKYCV